MKRRGRPKIEKMNLNVQRFQEALDYNHLSLRKLNTDNIAKVSERTLRRAKKDGMISPDILDRLGKRLNVDPLFLSGAYDNNADTIAKNEHEAKALKARLHVSDFPYIRKEQRMLDPTKYVHGLLIENGIPISEFDNLPSKTKIQIYIDLERATHKVLNQYFTPAISTDSQIFELDENGEVIENYSSTDKIMQVGSAITKYLFESYTPEYIGSVFSGKLDIDDFVDQVLLECIKYAFDNTQEKHSARHFLRKRNELTDDARMRYSRLLAIVNDHKEKETAHIKSYGVPVENEDIPDMSDITNRIDGYRLTEMNFLEITNIGELELIKAIINNRLPSAKKISNDRFIEIANQYDKFVLSLMEQRHDSDKKMVFNSLAYFTIEWMYAFNFLYQCASEMKTTGITETATCISKTGMLFGYRQFMSVLGTRVTTNSRMIGYREGLISDFLTSPDIEYQYCEMLSLVTIFTEQVKINDIPIKDWFVQNTDIHDWASFFKDYDVFRYVNNNKRWTRYHIRSIRQFCSYIFTENPENRSYADSFNSDILMLSNLKEDFLMNKYECYIEEYINDNGQLCARLREKKSNKKIFMDGDYFVWRHLLRFLSQAKKNLSIMPTVYNRDGTDIVAVRGIKMSEDADSINISLNALGAGYQYE